MKEIISYLYKINIIEEFKYDDDILYKDDKNISYLFKEVHDEKHIHYFFNLINTLNQYNFFAYNYKLNIYNQPISTYNEKKYVLINVKSDYTKNLDIDDLFDFYNQSNRLLADKINYTNSWDVLWENKIDYLTNHFNSNKNNNKKIDIIFNYYISLAESALLYLLNIKRTFSTNNHISITHRRVDFSITKYDFYNPLNFIIDIEQRDIGEYIKSLFYKDMDYLEDLNYYLKTHRLDKYQASMLFIRIVYPSIFFDDYEKNNVDLVKYFNFKKYENFIKKIYDVISSYILINKINWLN